MVGTIICEVGTIIYDFGTINMRFYLLEIRNPHGYRRITLQNHIQALLLFFPRKLGYIFCNFYHNLKVTNYLRVTNYE
jgi:hypothetical protein